MNLDSTHLRRDFSILRRGIKTGSVECDSGLVLLLPAEPDRRDRGDIQDVLSSLVSLGLRRGRDYAIETLGELREPVIVVGENNYGLTEGSYFGFGRIDEFITRDAAYLAEIA